MLYSSTRGGYGEYSSAEAIIQGLSPDGGLFVPSAFPNIVIDELKLMAGETYAERATRVISKFLDDFSFDEIKKITDKIYNKNVFKTNEVAPLYKLSRNVYFLELWHGPTCAFKDIALQFLPHILVMSLNKIKGGKEAVILTATSGDTGKAALEGFCGVSGVKIIVFYPSGGVSDIQKLQMTTQKGDNVCVAGVNGNFDDVQASVKHIFLDKSLDELLSNSNMFFSSANSINWGRLVPQIVYYFSSYVNLFNSGEISIGEKINIAVPTGNFGNILAAYYARLMGLPVNKFICASNSNNVLSDFMESGIYDSGRKFHLTASPSIDILISSNLERLIHSLSDCDCNYVKALMDDLKSTGRYCVNDYIKTKMKDTFWGGFCDDIMTGRAISSVFEEYGYLIDPHTAVAYDVYNQYIKQTGDTNTKTIIASTASPFKFADFVGKSLGIAKNSDDDFELLSLIAEKAGISQPDSLVCLKDADERFKQDIEVSGMQDFVLKFLGV